VSVALGFSSVIHPSDLRRGSEPAFAHALRIATATERGVELKIIHAASSLSGQRFEDFPAVRATLERWGLLPRGSAREDVFRTLGIEVNRVQARGTRVVSAVREYLVTHPADLVVLSTEGREGVPRWIQRSVAERLSRDSRAMTLFVPHAARGFVSLEDGSIDLRRVVVAAAHDPSARAAVQAAADFARALAPDRVSLSLLYAGPAASAPVLNPPEDPRLEWSALAREGPAVEVILREAEATQANLIVMATRGHDDFLDALRGSTTERVLRGAECPVLAVPVSRV
jgi:nucleotide-binding universal stress UspA family protein